MVELAQVVAALLEPPSFGRAILKETDGSRRTLHQVAWRTERSMTAGAWYVRSIDAGGRHSTSTFDGVTHRHFSGLRLVEQSEGRPDYWHPALHLLLPIKGYFWGRSVDDWRMHDDVQVQGDLAKVRLSSLDEGDYRGELVVDMKRRLLVAYHRPDHDLHVEDIRTHLLFDAPTANVARRVSDLAWLGPAPERHQTGVVRFAG